MLRGIRRIAAAGAHAVVARPVGSAVERVEPGDLLALGGPPDGEPDGDPRQPGAERPVGPPGRERPVRDHERLLGDVLGLGAIAEDPGAGRDDRATLALDELPEGSAVPGEHGIDDLALIARGSSVGDRGPRPVRRPRPPRCGARARPGRARSMEPRRLPIAMIGDRRGSHRRTEVMGHVGQMGQSAQSSPDPSWPDPPSSSPDPSWPESPPWSSPSSSSASSFVALVVVVGVLVLALVVVVGVLVARCRGRCCRRRRWRRGRVVVVAGLGASRPARSVSASRRSRRARSVSAVSAGSAVSSSAVSVGSSVSSGVRRRGRVVSFWRRGRGVGLAAPPTNAVVAKRRRRSGTARRARSRPSGSCGVWSSSLGQLR